jgi:polyferredoxin
MMAVDKPAKGGKSNRIKFFIWVPWILTILYFFIAAGGIKALDPFIATTMGFSVANPYSYIIYIPVLMLILIPALTAGRRSFCHYICWMAPFMIIGKRLGRLLSLPALRLKADTESCIDCMRCNKVCPMSLDVNAMVRTGSMFNDECILCGECADVCNKSVISFSFSKVKQQFKESI